MVAASGATVAIQNRGGVRADLTVIRHAQDRFRVIDGADAGHRDFIWLKRMAEDNGWNVYIDDRSDHVACLGVWGPNARKTIQTIADDPAAWKAAEAEIGRASCRERV